MENLRTNNETEGYIIARTIEGKPGDIPDIEFWDEICHLSIEAASREIQDARRHHIDFNDCGNAWDIYKITKVE